MRLRLKLQTTFLFNIGNYKCYFQKRIFFFADLFVNWSCMKVKFVKLHYYWFLIYVVNLLRITILLRPNTYRKENTMQAMQEYQTNDPNIEKDLSSQSQSETTLYHKTFAEQQSWPTIITLILVFIHWKPPWSRLEDKLSWFLPYKIFVQEIYRSFDFFLDSFDQSE